MASRVGHKRTSDVYDLDNDTSEDEVAQSDPRRQKAQQAKRARLAVADDDSDIEEEDLLSDQRNDNDEDDDMDEHDISGSSENQTDAQDEVANEAATQAVRARYTRTEGAQNNAAECAIIEEIICTNFMCHAHLAVKIGPLINFIIGHNGSGKSAVLTALQICLGGKATSTNRGQNLKSFIKEGKDYTVLSVRIKNQGEAAYKPDEYGRSIIVERHFNRAGTSGFKIKNANGKVVTTRRDDLVDLLDVFSLQLDNPMNVLTQDMARQFLNHSSPQDKYKFFQKGTHLEQLDHDYREMENLLEQIQAKTPNVQEDRKTIKEEYERMQAKAKRAENQKNLHNQHRTYQRQLAWALVADEEKILQDLEDEANNASEAVRTEQALVDKLDQDMMTFEHNKAQAQEALEELLRAMDPVQKDRDAKGTRFDDNKNELQKIQAGQRGLHQKIQKHEETIADTQRRISDEQQKLSDKDDGQHARQLEKLEALKARQAEIASEVRGLEAEQEEANTKETRARNMTRPISDELEQKRQAVAQQDRNIKQLQNKTGGHSWMQAYHQSLAALLKGIRDNSTRFREQPVGPLGRHIQLLKPEWSSILEKSFGAVLDGFAVTSKDDQRVLSDLMRRANYQARIFIGSSRPFGRALNEPPPNVLTWRRAMKIENQLVDNIILINQVPEQTVLIVDREEALNYQSTRPFHVKAILSMHDDRRGDGQRLTIGTGGGESSNFVQAWKGQPRMQTDEASQLNIAKEALQNRKGELQEVEQRMREANNRIKEAGQESAKIRRKVNQAREDDQRNDDEIEALQNELDAAVPEAGMLDALNDELDDYRKAKQTDEAQFDAALAAKDEINMEQKDLRPQVVDLDKKLEEFKLKRKKHDLRVIQSETARHNSVLQKNEAHAKVTDAEQARDRAVAKREEQSSKIEGYKKHAETICQRVPLDAGATSDSLDKLVQSHKAQIDRANIELGGTREEITEQAIAAKRKYHEVEKRWSQHELVMQTLKHTLNDRRDRWEKFRTYIAIRASGMFVFLLSERQFRGKLQFNHDKRTLDIHVEPDITRKSAQGRQTKTLSGGEKSFSTICLLLALWEAMGSPIRCLDEFDVFMDSVNREVAMDMMIKAARRSVGRQFILITPQAMGKVDFLGDVRIHRMTDPERGQQALPFGRA